MLLICHNNQKDSIKKNCEGEFLEGVVFWARVRNIGSLDDLKHQDY
jgi:hypothetical protein